ncbi:large ribosomal subunit protein bL36m [Emydura macquarii macquarii]|uniref:large ribosomal subunit protein bL36m n=1 Tax=Emydura macquarii macquarii TaxID=1129001 RepID=UPI00352A9E2A
MFSRSLVPPPNPCGRIMAALLLKTLLAAAATPLCYLRRGPAPRLLFSSLSRFGHLQTIAPAPALAAKSRCLAGQPLLASRQLPVTQAVMGMKTKGIVRRRCKDCFFVRRRGRLFVYCKTHPRHKQRQG